MKILETLNTMESNELLQTLRYALRESIITCPFEDITFYKNCSFDDYRNNLVEELWDDEGYRGDGISFITAAVLINEETLPIIKELFEQARDEEYASFTKE